MRDRKSWSSTKRGFMERTLKFTEKLALLLTLMYLCNWLVSVAMIYLAIKETKNFAYLDTLIVETSNTFRVIVGAAIIKFGVENIFKYNDFGGRAPSNGKYEGEHSEGIHSSTIRELTNNKGE